MTKSKATTAPQVLAVQDPSAGKGKLKRIGGSQGDDFNNIIINQAVGALWTKHSAESGKDQQFQATVTAMMGIGPRDESEGMLAAQMVAAHSATMECYRRAMLNEQTFEGRKENLNQANKLSRTYTLLMDALNRHRGKGQQKVTVEHVHIHSGGQAIVGAIEGGGVATGNQRQPHAKQIPHALKPALWSENPEREPLPVSRDAER